MLLVNAHTSSTCTDARPHLDAAWLAQPLTHGLGLLRAAADPQAAGPGPPPQRPASVTMSRVGSPSRQRTVTVRPANPGGTEQRLPRTATTLRGHHPGNLDHRGKRRGRQRPQRLGGGQRTDCPRTVGCPSSPRRRRVSPARTHHASNPAWACSTVTSSPMRADRHCAAAPPDTARTAPAGPAPRAAVSRPPASRFPASASTRMLPLNLTWVSDVTEVSDQAVLLRFDHQCVA